MTAIEAERTPMSRIVRVGKSATVLMVLMMLTAGVVNIAGIKPPFERGYELGYPPYVPAMLGVAKLLGVATFLTRRVPTLREWAYAGFAFELVGGALSHLLAGHGLLHALPYLFDLSFVLTSYLLW